METWFTWVMETTTHTLEGTMKNECTCDRYACSNCIQAFVDSQLAEMEQTGEAARERSSLNAYERRSVGR